MLLVSLDCPFLIAPSVFCNILRKQLWSSNQPISNKNYPILICLYMHCRWRSSYQEREGWGPISLLNSATCFGLSEARIWISNVIGCVFFCVQWVQLRWEVIVSLCLILVDLKTITAFAKCYRIFGLFVIVVSNTYCAVFLFCVSSSCVPYAASLSGLSIFDCPFGIL
jgi:hypothetical protein